MAGTWSVVLSNVASGISLSFEMVILAECQPDQHRYIHSEKPLLWPLPEGGRSSVSIAAPEFSGDWLPTSTGFTLAQCSQFSASNRSAGEELFIGVFMNDTPPSLDLALTSRDSCQEDASQRGRGCGLKLEISASAKSDPSPASPHTIEAAADLRRAEIEVPAVLTAFEEI